MLKSIILIPSNDIMSYCDHPEYPFNIFPHLIIRYKKNIIKLDNRDLSLLYHLNTKNYDEECNKNEYQIYFKSSSLLSLPLNLLLENNYNYNNLQLCKFNNIKKILPFCDNINNLIINKINKEYLNWTFRSAKPRNNMKNEPIFNNNKLYFINKYVVTNESIIPYKSIINYSIRISPKIKYKKIYCTSIIYGIYDTDSYIPSQINVININSTNLDGNIPINTFKENIVKILYFTVEQKIRDYVCNTLDSDDDYAQDNPEEIVEIVEKYLKMAIVY